MKLKSWKIYNCGRWFDTVFFDADCSWEYVRRSLIEHDGFPCTIQTSS